MDLLTIVAGDVILKVEKLLILTTQVTIAISTRRIADGLGLIFVGSLEQVAEGLMD